MNSDTFDRYLAKDLDNNYLFDTVNGTIRFSSCWRRHNPVGTRFATIYEKSGIVLTGLGMHENVR
jgi:hypothetical protein